LVIANRVEQLEGGQVAPGDAVQVMRGGLRGAAEDGARGGQEVLREEYRLWAVEIDVHEAVAVLTGLHAQVELPRLYRPHLVRRGLVSIRRVVLRGRGLSPPVRGYGLEPAC